MGLSLNIVASLSLIPRTIGPSVASRASSTILASTHPVFAVETAAMAFRTDVMNWTASTEDYEVPRPKDLARSERHGQGGRERLARYHQDGIRAVARNAVYERLVP